MAGGLCRTQHGHFQHTGRGAEPTHFAPPGQRITTANLGILRGAGYGMRVRSAIEGLTSRIYHCDDAFCPSPILCSTAWLDAF